MHHHIDGTSDKKPRSIAGHAFAKQRESNASHRMADNRPEAIQMRRITKIMQHHSGIRSLTTGEQIAQRVTSANSAHWNNPGHNREKNLAYQYAPADLAQLARNLGVPSGDKLVISIPRRPPRNAEYLSHYILVVAFTQGAGPTTANDHIDFITAYFSPGAATQGEPNTIYVNRSGAWRPDEG